MVYDWDKQGEKDIYIYHDPAWGNESKLPYCVSTSK